jgi:hypothetical protein
MDINKLTIAPSRAIRRRLSGPLNFNCWETQKRFSLNLSASGRHQTLVFFFIASHFYFPNLTSACARLFDFIGEGQRHANFGGGMH